MRSALPQVQVELVASNSLGNLLRREAAIAVRMVRPEQPTVIAVYDFLADALRRALWSSGALQLGHALAVVDLRRRYAKKGCKWS